MAGDVLTRGSAGLTRAAEPEAEARNPSSGIANAAVANIRTAMKLTLFKFICLSLSNVFSELDQDCTCPTTRALISTPASI
jgi:hypothetical protein